MERSCLPPGLVGKIIPTRGPLAYIITYCIFPHVTVYLDRSDLLSRELMYDTLYPWKRVGGLKRYARYCIFLTSWQSLKEKSYQLAFQTHITGHHHEFSSPQI